MDLGPLHFRALRASLSQLPVLAGGAIAAGQPAALEQAHKLKRQLDTSRPAFRKLLEKLPPNPKEKEELEKGELDLETSRLVRKQHSILTVCPHWNV